MNPVITTTFLAAVLIGPFAQAQAGTKVYVPLGSAGEVIVIDAARDEIVATISDLPDVHGLAGAAGAEYLVAGRYVESSTEGEEALPPKPAGMSEETHRAHHPKKAGPAPAKGAAVSFVSVIRIADGSIVRRIEVPGAVHHTAVTPDGRYAVATHPGGGGVSVIDLSTFQVTNTVPTGPSPNYAVASADSKRIYVDNQGNDTVSEIDVERWIVRRNLVTGSSPGHMALSPDGEILYVGNDGDGTVSAISLRQGEAVRTFEIGGALHGVDLSDDGRTLFVSGREQNKVVAVDLESGTIRSAPLGPSPYHLAVIRGTGKLYVSSAEEPTIWVVDQRSLQVLSTIPIRGEGHQMVVVQE